MSRISSTRLYLGYAVVGVVAVQSFMLPVLAHTKAAPGGGTVTPVVPVTVQHPTPVVAVQTPTVRHKVISQVASRLSGIASWYGLVLHGHHTASGEIFDETQLTACHRTLPFGTMVRVTNLRNHQSVVVKINDRGVLNPDRVIDLSSAAADKIGMLRAGTAPVKLSIVPASAAQNTEDE